MTMPESGSCFLCGRRVLGLVGQDYMLDSYYLQTGDKALAASAYGPCHVKCLLNSDWGQIWATYLLRHMINIIGLPIVGKVGNLTAIRRAKLKHTTIIRKDGLICIVPDNELKKARSVIDGSLVRVIRDFSFDLADNVQIARTIQETLVERGSYPLPQLITDLDLTDQLFFPVALESGELRFSKKDVKIWREHKSEVEGKVWGQALYFQFVPEAMMALARASAQT